LGRQERAMAKKKPAKKPAKKPGEKRTPIVTFVGEEEPAAPTCPRDPNHGPMTLQTGGSWFCRCGEERLPVPRHA
jgi:hypothetical protein